MVWFFLSTLFFSGPSEPKFDLKRITTPVEPYRVVYRGRIVGCVDFFFEREGDELHWRSLEGVGPSNRVETSFTTNFGDVTSWRYTAEGQIAKKDFSVDLHVKEEQLVGSLIHGDHKSSMEDAGMFVEQDAFFFLFARALVIEDNETYAVTLMDSRSLARRPITIEVTGVDTVLVPQGTFEAHRLVVNGMVEGVPSQRIIHITKDAPYRVLQVAYFPEGIRYELLPKTLETVLREIQNQNEVP